jgi:hypothetical protein
MSNTLGLLMERNLLEVFGQRDSARRVAVIAELYTVDCTFFEAEEQVTGREALNAKVESILRRLSRVRTLRSLSTEESEPCTPSLMSPRAPEVTQAVGGGRYSHTAWRRASSFAVPSRRSILPMRRSSSTGLVS